SRSGAAEDQRAMMVRINLAPSKKRGPSGDALWRVVAVMAVLFLAELVLIWWIHWGKSEEGEAHAQQLAQNQQSVQTLEAEIAAIPNLSAKVTELESRETELAKIAAVRFGPQHVFDELKRILSRPSTKTTIKEARDAGWNVAWEAENVFLDRFFESSAGV